MRPAFPVVVCAASGSMTGERSSVIWLLTCSGWVLVGAIAGRQAVDLVPNCSRFAAPFYSVLGATGGVVGGAGISVLGVETTDSAWILSMFTCVLGAVVAVLLATGGALVVVRARRRRSRGAAEGLNRCRDEGGGS